MSEPGVLARLLRRAKRTNTIEHCVLEASAKALEAMPVLSFADLEQAFASEWVYKRIGTTIVLKRKSEGSFRSQNQTSLIIPFFIRGYLERNRLTHHWREDLPSSFLSWLVISAPEFNKAAGDRISYLVNTEVPKKGN